MLESMRKHMNWIMWVILVLIIVTFMFFGIYPSASSGGVAAKVDGYVITTTEVNRVHKNMVENYRQIFKDQFSDALSKSLRSQALRELVQNRLLIQEAERIGIRVSDEELQASIMKIPAFNQQGRFDKTTYDRYLNYVNITPAVFEASQRESLLRQKLENIVEDGVDATDVELAAAYASRNPKAKAGEFEKKKDSFKQTFLTEKRRTALEAYVQGLQKKATVKMNEKALES